MMGLQTIRQRNREVAEEAAMLGLTPFVYFDESDVLYGDTFPFPFIGDYRPEGWEIVDTHFVDSSGLGDDNEPALSVRQFRELIAERIATTETTVGWAVIEAGQFQVYVGEFHKS